MPTKTPPPIFRTAGFGKGGLKSWTRLFRDREELAKAAALIHKHHYDRRFAELADAEEAAKGW